MITPTDQFFEAIKKCLKEVLREELSSLQKEKQETYNTAPVLLSRYETAKFLKISLSTLHNRTKAGVYKSLKTGDTVLYDQDDLIKQIKSNQNRIV
jgi:hypothetical protein